MQCKTASVDGAIEKAQDVVIHPNAVVRAANGASITIGAGCVIEELCVIEASSGCHIEIGRGNLFQVVFISFNSTPKLSQRQST